MVTLAEELPFAVVAKDAHLGMVCSSCFASKKDRPLSRCIGCKVVNYCDVDCQKKDWVNHKHECKFLLNYAPRIPRWMCRLIARIALKLRRSGDEAHKPAFNGKVYDDLMDHREEIQKDRERMDYVAAITPILREYMGAKFVPGEDLLLSIYGKIAINSFAIGDEKDGTGVGIYLGLSVHNHSCAPNAFISFDGIKAVLRSPNKDQKYSKDLTISYTDLLRSNKHRKHELRDTYYFTCTCEVCSDPTMDFLYNSAYSTCCPDSYCLLDPDAKQLNCNKCGAISGITVKQAIYANERIILMADNMREETSWDPDKSTYLAMLVELYEIFSKILSPLNVNLLLVNDRLVGNALDLRNRTVSRQYASLLLPAYRRYLPVGDTVLSDRLTQIAHASSYDVAPTKNILDLSNELCLCSSVIAVMSSSSIVSGSRSSRPVGNPTMLPVGVLLDILMQCDYETLLNVEKSCEFFQKLVDNRFWLRKCRREKIAVPSAAWDAFPKPLSSDEKESSDAQELPVKKARQEYEEPREPKLYQFDYKKLYCKNPLNRNLAHPMEADTTLEELERDHNVTFHHSGDGIAIEVVPESASNELEDPRVKSCFALSFDWCCRSFVINLVEIGLDADFIDHIRPKITFRELCCCRNDCGARYALAVALLSNEEEILNDFPVARMVELGKEWAQWEGGKKWETVEHVFEDYPAGVRRIYVNSTGKDTQFWAGHYGPKFTNTEVIIEMPSKLQWRSKNDVVDTEVEEERRN